LDSLKNKDKSLSTHFRDEYIFDFIDEDNIKLEKDLESSILKNL